ncbi:MAG: lytic transglycosylase domain-containing protein [Armatimonadetes bacterium]|nr:lytic transglycosylase domain-containing protein [Armatimonadota bacterium]
MLKIIKINSSLKAKARGIKLNDLLTKKKFFLYAVKIMKFLRAYFLLLILFLNISIQSVHSAGEKEIELYLKAYRQAVSYFNPNLTLKNIDLIVRSIVYYSQQYKLDPRMVMAVVAIESTFKVYATSPAGAQGLGQLMPETANALNLSNPYDPLQNIQATVRILKLNFNRFKRLPYQNQVENALASYNAGYGAVLKYGGIPPYQETRWYVYTVIYLWRKFCGLN